MGLFFSKLSKLIFFINFNNVSLFCAFPFLSFSFLILSIYFHIYMRLFMYNCSGAFQLFERRSKVVHAGEEQERFSVLTLDYMSEELSSDGGETMIVHQPPWRSSSKLCFLS